MRRSIRSVAFVVIVLAGCPTSRAQGPSADALWEACLKAPTRACVLDEAEFQAFSVEPSARRTAQIGMIAEALATARNLPAALRIASWIPADHVARANTLRAIAAAQARLGMPASVCACATARSTSARVN